MHVYVTPHLTILQKKKLLLFSCYFFSTIPDNYWFSSILVQYEHLWDRLKPEPDRYIGQTDRSRNIFELYNPSVNINPHNCQWDFAVQTFPRFQTINYNCAFSIFFFGYLDPAGSGLNSAPSRSGLKFVKSWSTIFVLTPKFFVFFNTGNQRTNVRWTGAKTL